MKVEINTIEDVSPAALGAYHTIKKSFDVITPGNVAEFSLLEVSKQHFRNYLRNLISQTQKITEVD